MSMNTRCSWLAVVAVFLIVANPSLRAAEVDDQIEAAFKKSYVYSTYLKDDKIQTVAKDGVVTLTGTVAEDFHKDLAQETAANLPGVIRVDNQLATTGEVAAEKSDTWIGRKIKIALLFRRNVDAGKTTVVVKDGVVTLTGVATSAAQRDLTTEYAHDIDGVKEVKNEMTVAVTPEIDARNEGLKIDDASIAAQVKTALTTHRSTRATKTKVLVRNGEVVLTGVVKNDADSNSKSK